MYCLHCGDCCKRFSPISQPEPCPYLKYDGEFYFCSTYNHRPEKCVNHKYQSRFCPIGLSVLKLDVEDDADKNKIRARIDDFYEKYGFQECEVDE